MPSPEPGIPWASNETHLSRGIFRATSGYSFGRCRALTSLNKSLPGQGIGYIIIGGRKLPRSEGSSSSDVQRFGYHLKELNYQQSAHVSLDPAKYGTHLSRSILANIRSLRRLLVYQSQPIFPYFIPEILPLASQLPFQELLLKLPQNRIVDSRFLDLDHLFPHDPQFLNRPPVEIPTK